MSDRIDFYEVRVGSDDDYDHVCMCKCEDQAQKIVDRFTDVDETLCARYFIERIEIVAETNLTLGDY
tara:strand:+ start:3803 stop:4003 length:201 start_codon:yes stop_codon:yes gene_type:complete